MDFGEHRRLNQSTGNTYGTVVASMALVGNNLDIVLSAQAITEIMADSGGLFAIGIARYYGGLTREAGIIFGDWDGSEPLSIGILLRLIDENDKTLAEVKQLHRTHRNTLQGTIEQARQTYRRNAKARADLDSATYTHRTGSPPTK